jgi:hypothetical protein
MYCDVDPDDALVLSDGRLAILDYGLTSAVESDRLDAAADALNAFAENDSSAFGAAVRRFGWLPSDQASGALALGRDALGELGGPDPARLDSDAVLDAGRRLLSRPELVGELIASGAPGPLDLWPAMAAGQLFAAIARVGATGPWRELARSALRDGWSASAEAAGR